MNPFMLGCTKDTVWVRKDGIKNRVSVQEAELRIAEGWTRGLGNVFSAESIAHQAKVRSGRTIVYDNPNKTFKRVTPDLVQSYLEQGWELKQTYKFRKSSENKASDNPAL
jgi:hypothetical protein